MVKKKALFISGILILILILAGCQGRLPGKRGTENANVEDFRTGSDGIQMNFLEGSPPRSMFKGDPLELVVEYSNKGAADVEAGYIYISGYDKQYITFLNDWVMFNAEGKDEFNPQGEMSETYTFTDDAVNIPQGTDKYSPEFLLTACYSYMTEASAEVCIDPDPYNVQPKLKTCSVQSVSLGTQGAPVAVTSVEPTLSKNRVQFKIYLSNVGDGDVIFLGGSNAGIMNCHTRLRTDDLNKVEVSARFSDKSLICKPDPVRMPGGKGVVSCYYEGYLGEEAYTTLLNVNVYYGYRNSITTSTTVHRLPGE